MTTAEKVSLVPEKASLETVPAVNFNLFWQSTLFNEVYLQKDVPLFHKDVWVDDEVAFEQFLNQFRNFCGQLDGEKPTSWSERTTINRFIKPMLEMLGYTSADGSNIEPFLEDEAFSFVESDGNKTYKPDFVVVNNQKELKYIQDKKGREKLEEARASVFLPIEAKYWDRIEEYRLNRREDAKRADKKDTSSSERGMDFDEQCLKYMEMLNKPYGILTDGKTWRLYNLSISTPNYKPYFQFNLGRMIKHVTNSDFLKSTGDYDLFRNEIKYFYFIFRKKALYSESGEELFVDSLMNYSKKYVSRVEEDLKERFVNTMSIACNGFKRALEDSRDKATDLELIRNVAESHIFNVLFLRYCEARGILPIKQDPDGYRAVSISHVIDKLDGFEPERERDNLNIALLKRRFSDIKYDPSGTQLYDRLLKITKIVQEGNKGEFKGFSIKGFKESIFSNDEWKFVQKYKLSNQEMVCILFELGYSKSDIQGRKYQQIPYSSFSPRQLGSIYESFLEFKLEKADEDLAFIKRQWKPANLKSEKIINLGVPTVKKGQLFFTPNNEERKATGSYYTPDPIVQMIVAETLQPLVKGKTAEELLKLSVCDPAMGSGHFLSATLNYIAKLYLEKVDDEVHDDMQLSLVSAKQRVLHNCIYGVDINPRAVKLAKLSLWMETADPAIVLEDLDDQLKTADSLLTDFKKIFSASMHAFVGNPPYVATYSRFSEKENLKNLEQYERIYKCMSGRKNTFLMFIEKVCIEADKNPQSRWSLIVPKTILTMDAYFEIRNFLFSGRRIHAISEFGYEVFEDATVPVCILYGAGSSATGILVNRQKMDKGPLENLMHLQYEELLKDPQMKINSGIGGVAKKIITKVMDKKLSVAKMPDEFTVCDGINPGPFREELTSDTKQAGYVELIEKAKYVTAYKVSIPARAYFDARPGAVDKLYKKNPDKVNSRAVIGDLKRFQTTKIIYRQTAPFHTACLDSSGLLHYNSCHSILGEDENDLRLLLSWINSDLCRFIFSKLFKEKEGAFPQIKVKHTRSIPVPIFKNIPEAKRLISLTKQAESKSSDVNDLQSQMNDIFYGYYGISKEERRAIIESLEPVVETEESEIKKKKKSA